MLRSHSCKNTFICVCVRLFDSRYYRFIHKSTTSFSFTPLHISHDCSTSHLNHNIVYRFLVVTNDPNLDTLLTYSSLLTVQTTNLLLPTWT